VNVTLQRAAVTRTDRVTSSSSHASRSRWPLKLRDVLRVKSAFRDVALGPIRLPYIPFTQVKAGALKSG
jgi:hypothetical protein